ncbi:MULTISPECIES: hypothetical protein [unclassified Oleiphilus]|nr:MULTISPECIES: hypothetical protein [unclassified Oleiphilus]KZY75154.1 hypothetical protein A3741_12625 [Oleiphilus sp. HI0069]KZZ33069.1 hypothetical protein A3755_08600 [Oleiphilus sp. HI0085]KZY56466.1 hypothetical protein A3735_04585 [Oleiphilus sp. HI0061]KZZ37246.1 hypothetical protein A3757_01815 [Oleiphilus sp. HI0117]KZZ57152.1 hypothetical protein A3761_06980 [Oleiphilus sp. HI0123]
MKKSIIGLVVVAGSVTVYQLSVNSMDIANTSLEPESILGNYSLEVPVQAVNETELGASEYDDFDLQILAQLRADYKEHIAELKVQASLLTVKRYILEKYPESGEERFTRLVLAAFPEFAESIFRVIEGLERYQNWVSEEYLYLEELSPLAKNGMLWEKRREIFGSDAELIWQDEKDNLNQSKLRMQEVFHQLDQSNETSLDEKLFQLRSAIDENLAGSVQDAALSEGVISRAFFNLSSVQKGLSEMPAEERQIEIDNIRRQLGYSEEQIETLAAKDQEREARWQTGYAYMAERAELVASLDAEQLDESLAELRQKYFEHEAVTIQREEEMDFWRFNRPRKFGNN